MFVTDWKCYWRIAMSPSLGPRTACRGKELPHGTPALSSRAAAPFLPLSLSLLLRPTSPYTTGGNEQEGTEVMPETSEITGGRESARDAYRRQDRPRGGMSRCKSVSSLLGWSFIKALKQPSQVSSYLPYLHLRSTLSAFQAIGMWPVTSGASCIQ